MPMLSIFSTLYRARKDQAAFTLISLASLALAAVLIREHQVAGVMVLMGAAQTLLGLLGYHRRSSAESLRLMHPSGESLPPSAESLRTLEPSADTLAQAVMEVARIRGLRPTREFEANLTTLSEVGLFAALRAVALDEPAQTQEKPAAPPAQEKPPVPPTQEKPPAKEGR